VSIEMNEQPSLPLDPVPRKRRYWIIVASRDRVEEAKSMGCCIVNRGKEAPLHKMSPGDWIVYYSPQVRNHTLELAREFTAIALVQSAQIEVIDVSPDFRPYCRKVQYAFSIAVPISRLLPRLSFLPDKQRWSERFRSGFLEVTYQDFNIIAEAMGVRVPKG